MYEIQTALLRTPPSYEWLRRVSRYPRHEFSPQSNFDCFAVSNPPEPSDLNFSSVVNAVAGEITTHFTIAYPEGNSSQLSEFGTRLLDVKDPKDIGDPTVSRLMDILQSQKELKEKFVQLLKLWPTTKEDPKWEDVIEALQCIGLKRLAKELEDDLKRNQSQNGLQTHEVQESSIQGNFRIIATCMHSLMCIT